MGESPARIEIITREDIEKSGARDLSELLIDKLPSHFHRYPGALTSVDIRGFRTDTHGTDIKGRVLILIDGHRAGTGNITTIPLENVERVEIVRGPASVLYGSAAMGGVINIITRYGAGKPKVELGGEYGGWNQFRTWGSVSSGVWQDKIGISVSGRTYQQLDDYKAGSGDRLENTQYHDEAYSISLRATPFENHTLYLLAQYFRAWDVGTPGAIYSPDYNDYKNILHRYLSLAYEGSIYNVRYRVSAYTVMNRDKWLDPDMAWEYFSTATQAETSGTRAQASIPTFSFGTLTIGTDWDHIGVISWREPPSAPFSPRSRYDNYGLFGEEKIKWDRLALTLGVRHDIFDESIKRTFGLNVTPDSESFSHTSWRSGATYEILEGTFVRASIGTGFRAPSADELAGRYQTIWTKLVGNPDLKPEKSTTYEFGIDLRRHKISAGFDFFCSDYTDRISSGFRTCIDNDCSWNTYKNVEGAKLAALEAYGSYSIALSRSFSIEPFINGIYYVKRKVEDDSYVNILGSDMVPYVSRENLILGFTIAYLDKAEVTFQANYHGRQYVQDWNYFSPTYGKAIEKGGFTLYSLRFSCHPLPNLTPYLRIDNITNKEYSFVDGYPMPGVKVIGGLRYNF
ncbi:MAG: TonB-dependent receptor [Syntrophobacterales bacterium]|nr:TonB-dependent receptor [Syntrophobacterales bacterium]